MRAFTLVEILIVVVMLGILAAVVIPQYTNATEEARGTTTFYELEKVRRAIDVYQVRNDNTLPTVTEGIGTWGELLTGSYLKTAPRNQWIGQNQFVIVFGNAADVAYQTDHGWIYDPATGDVWAGSFDANGDPYPQP